MPTDTQRSLVLRLRRIEGQVRGIQRMIEEEAECNQILTQIAAVKSAVSQVGLLVFEHHARDCISEALNATENEDRFDEIVKMMERLIK
ncbi:MAG: metal-sensitive transcriptional regulator [Bacillota bacterium]|nr:metal-sensitive transcriptional regulator [Bacillota bacterium]